MINLAGYQIDEELYESANSVAYRGRREQDALPVVIKALKEAFPPPRELARYQKEWEIAALLKDLPGIARVLGLERFRNSLALIVEDFGA